MLMPSLLCHRFNKITTKYQAEPNQRFRNQNEEDYFL